MTIDFLIRAWRDGVGPDELDRLELLDPAEGGAECAMFAAACELVSGRRAALLGAPAGAAAAVVHAALVVIDATLARMPAALASAIAELAAALEVLPDTEPRAPAAFAWADFALGQVGLAAGDRRAARLRLEAVAAPGRPVALRIAATLQLAELAVERDDLGAARAWSRRAATLACVNGRPRDAERTRLVCALLDHAVGDLPAMRATVYEAVERNSHRLVVRLLFATMEHGTHAAQRISDVLAEAAAGGDPLTYALCVLVAARRWGAIGCAEDALTVLEIGIASLAVIAPKLADVLIDEYDRCSGVTSLQGTSHPQQAAG